MVLIWSCNTGPSHQQKVETNPQESTSLPADFLEFYERFHQDTTYQLDHIVWPLAGRPGALDTLSLDENGSFFWEKDKWTIHKPFNHDAQFDREFEVLGSNLVNEISTHQEHGVTMLRRFAKTSGGWNLIYYAAP